MIYLYSNNTVRQRHGTTFRYDTLQFKGWKFATGNSYTGIPWHGLGVTKSTASPGPLQSLSNKNWRGRRLGLAQYTLYRLFSPASHLILSPGIINQHTDYPDWPDMDEEEEEINKSEPPFGERLLQSFCELVPIFRAVFEILLC